MTKLAAFVISGYGQAALCIAGFAWLALIVPFGSLLSGSALGLFAFRFGYQRALLVMIFSTLILFVLLWITDYFQIMLTETGNVFLFLFLQWLPIIGLVQLVRTTQSLSMLFQFCAVVSVLAVLGIFLLVPDSAAMWADFFRWTSQGNIDTFLESRSDIVKQYDALLELMTGFAVSSMLLVWIASVLLAYWWQFLLLEPGGFKKSFTAIKLGKAIAVFGLVILAAAALVESSFVTELIIVLMTIFLFQGIATVHFLLSRLNEGKLFLFLFYGSLVLSPIVPLLPILVGVFGILESFIDLRGRVERSDLVG